MLLLRALDVYLLVGGGDELLAEARSVGLRISEALPDETMRRRFNESETMQRILRVSFGVARHRVELVGPRFPAGDSRGTPCSLARSR